MWLGGIYVVLGVIPNTWESEWGGREERRGEGKGGQGRAGQGRTELCVWSTTVILVLQRPGHEDQTFAASQLSTLEAPISSAHPK